MLTAVLCLMFAFATPEDEIRAVMDRQVEAWNRGDVVAFMDAYLESDSITFMGSSGITRGWQGTLDRYRHVYSSREKMGKLTFSELEFRSLGRDHMLVLGRFELQRNAEGGGNAAGRYTLVFLRTPKGWKVVHDHTS